MLAHTTRERLAFLTTFFFAVAIAVWGLHGTGCGSVLQASIATLNTTAEASELWVQEVELAYDDALLKATSSDGTGDEMRARVDVVDLRFAPAFKAYRTFRAAWMAAAQALVAIQAGNDGAAIDLAPLVAEVLALAQAMKGAL